MPHFIVFGSEEHEEGQGKNKTRVMYWLNRPVGVFEAPGPVQACQAAAHKMGNVANFFAVEGLAWGIAFMEKPAVKEFGAPDAPDAIDYDKLGAALQRQLGRGDE